MKRYAVIFRDIGNYHAARLGSVSKNTNFELNIVEVTSNSGFEAFRANAKERNNLSIYSLGSRGTVDFSKVSTPLRTMLAKLRPDAVFIPGWSMVESLVALGWCVDTGTPAIVMSASTQHDFKRQRLKEFVKRRVLRAARAAIVGGNAQGDYLQALGLPKEQIFFGYNTVDNSYFSTGADRARADERSQRARLSLPDRYIFCASRLVEKKNLFRLLDAYNKYFAQAGDDPSSLVIAGPGHLHDALNEKIIKLGLDQEVHLLGAVKYADMAICYGLAEALILPSTIEQWGLVVNEAMASGLPILISNRCGCVPELIIEGRNGLIFDPFETETISESIKLLMSASCDRKQMGQESREIIKDWDLGRFATGFEAAAERAIATKKNPLSWFDRLLIYGLARL